MPVHVVRYGLVEMRVDERFASPSSNLGWFDEHQFARAELPGNPGGDAVAGRVPTVRKGISLEETIGWSKYGDFSAVDLAGDRIESGDDHCLGNPVGEEPCRLVHGPNRHPVCRTIGKTEFGIQFPNSIGQRPTARNDEDAIGTSENVRDRSEDPRFGPRPTPNFHDGMDTPLNAIPIFTHEFGYPGALF